MKKGIDRLWVLSLLPLVVAAVAYPWLPAEIPMNWDMGGEVGTYMARGYIFLTAAIAPAMTALFLLLPRLDPLRRNLTRFEGQYRNFILLMILFILGLNILVIVESLAPGTVSVPTVLVVAVGLLYAYLGNVMPKFKRNFIIGLRTPWTLMSPDVWFKTHRLGGRLFFFGGLVIVVSTPIVTGDTARLVLLLAVTAVLAGIPTVMSYIWWVREKREASE